MLLLVIVAQSAYGQIEVDSMFIYKQVAINQNFTRAGSTARLKLNHKHLDSTQAMKAKLSEQEISDVKRIFQKTNHKRFYQQKHAGEIYYALIWYGGKSTRYIIEGDSNWTRLVNLDTMRKWTLNQPERVKDFKTIISKNWL